MVICGRLSYGVMIEAYTYFLQAYDENHFDAENYEAHQLV